MRAVLSGLLSLQHTNKQTHTYIHTHTHTGILTHTVTEYLELRV